MADLLFTDLVREILSHLPVKSLLRFRCLSVHFCALIDSPNFVKQHLDRSILTKNNHLSLLIQGCELYLASLQRLDQPPQLNHHLKFPHYANVIGSINGLLCLNHLDRETIFIWNPATQRYHMLPRPCVFSMSYMKSVVTFCGFGYDSVSDDYKILRFDQLKDGGSYVSTKAQLYSLRSNSWRTIQDLPYYLLNSRHYGGFACGALHWMALTLHQAEFQTKEIVAFDLFTNKYEVVAKPTVIDQEGMFMCCMSLGELGDCLSLTCNYNCDRVDVWVMKNYGVKKSWSKLFSISQPKGINSYTEVLKPLAYSEKGDEILLVIENKNLLWYNPDMRTVRVIHGYDDEFEASICVESMVSPVSRT